MKTPVIKLTFLFVVLCSFIIHGKTKYVTDVFEITLRREPNSRSKVLAMPKSGTSLEVLEQSGNWTYVKLNSGKKKEGWVLTRYLDSKQPSALSLKYVQKKYDQSKETIKEKKKEISDLRRAVDSLSRDNKNTSRKLRTTESSYENLKKESTEYLSLKANYTRTRTELDSASTFIHTLASANDTLRSDERKQWFIIGASVIALGFLVGLYMGTKKRKNRYYR